MRLLKEVRGVIGGYQVKSGVFHYFRGEYKQAVDFFRKALSDPACSAADRRNATHFLTLALLRAAERHAQEGDHDASISNLRDATATSPTFPDLHFRLGEALEHVDRIDEALDAYGAAVENSRGFVDARVALARCLIRAGRREEAKPILKEALELRVAALRRPFRQAITRLEAAEDDAAEELIHQVFHASPELGRLHLKKALAFLASEEYEKALVELDHAVELHPNYPDLHNYRGVALIELERGEEAIEAFRRSVGLAPHQVVPRLNLACALERAGRYKDAEPELEAILVDYPDEPAALAKLEELRKAMEPKGPARSAR